MRKMAAHFCAATFIQSTIIFLLHTYKYHYEYIVHYNRDFTVTRE